MSLKKNDMIIVTGISGYIGSHMAAKLLTTCQFNILGLDSVAMPKNNGKILKDFSDKANVKLLFEQVDLTDGPVLRDIIGIFKMHYNIVAVMHFASFKSVEESVKDPLKYYNNNLIGTINLLSIMSAFKLDNFIFSSSATVYNLEMVAGDIAGDKHCEKDYKFKESDFELSKMQANAYGSSKYMIEHMLGQLNLNSISLRYFNVVNYAFGLSSISKSENLMDAILKSRAMEQQLIIYKSPKYSKTELKTIKDPTCHRDFIHISDLVEGHMLALNKLLSSSSNALIKKAYNLGSGHATSVLTLVNCFIKVNNCPLDYKLVDTTRPGDVHYSCSDTTLAEKELGFKCTKTLNDLCLLK